MTAAPQTAALETRVGPLPQPGSHMTEISALFHEMLESIEHYSAQASGVIYRELETLSRVIAEANDEIVAIRPKEIWDEHMPGATDELDAVVGHTEEATNTIFGAVEAIEGVLAEMPPETAAKVTDAVTQIYEACSFQDITGQRIAKVIRALKEVQTRVGTMLVAFGSPKASGTAPANGDGASMNGPQLPQKASSQADIDALLGSTPAAAPKPADQGDIDALFSAPAPKAASPKAASPKDDASLKNGPQLPQHAPNQADIDALLAKLG
jgi:chemotaxis protein CheZ